MKAKLFFLFSITVFATASFVLDIFNYNPYKSDYWVFVSMFISLFLSLTGIGALAIFLVKIKITKSKNYSPILASSIRQGLLVALSIAILLVLQSLSLLDWWVGGPLVLAVILLELFFKTITKTKKLA